MTKYQHLLVNEIFGPTVQGEGPSIGKQCVFLRLGACNLHCVWCDTPYTWRFSDTHPHQDNIVYDKAEELHTTSFNDVFDKLLANGLNAGRTLVISGGEPMLQADAIFEFISWFGTGMMPRIEIETAGTIWNEALSDMDAVFFNVSPKLASSGNTPKERYKWSVLNRFGQSDRAIFKFVVTSSYDFDEIEDLIGATKIPKARTYIMPEGATKARFLETQQALAEEAIQRGFNLTTRLHILVWDKKRGV
jgi:7-carboxy-7-deazaguanine synthase